LDRNEEWRPVRGFEGSYEVSNFGRVRRLLILTPDIDKSGYARVRLGKHNERRTVHSLVAEAFIGARPVGREINHKNADKIDNRPENLEYLTQRANMAHAVGLRLHARGEDHRQTHLADFAVWVIRRMCREGHFTQTEIGRIFAINQTTVSHIARGTTWQHVAD
jgi:hypothetical protein